VERRLGSRSRFNVPLQTLDFIGYRWVCPQEYSRVEHVEHVERSWKQLEQLVKTTSFLRRATRAAIQERREVSRRDEERAGMLARTP